MTAADLMKKAYYRTFQEAFNIGARCLKWCKPRLVTGAGAMSKIPSLLDECHVGKVMVVTGSHIVRSLGPQLFDILENAGVDYAVFSDVEANPSVATVNKIYEKYVKLDCEGFIAMGGGSPMDAAKAAAARAARPGKSVDDMTGLLKVGRKLPPFIAVPTTSGSGSETTIAAVITDPLTSHKCAVMDLHLIPRYAVLDPELVAGLPGEITATTGMDALTHAVEAYLCWTYNTRESLQDAEEAVKIIFLNLERAYRDGNDIEAREAMMMAAFKAGYAFTRAGVGNVHAIAHTLGGIYNTPHGLANAVILPIVLEDYGAEAYQKLARLAEITNLKTTGTAKEKAEAFISEIRAMNQRMDIPNGFEYIKDADIPRMISWALAEANPVYPVPVVYNEARCRRVILRIRNEASRQS